MLYKFSLLKLGNQTEMGLESLTICILVCSYFIECSIPYYQNLLPWPWKVKSKYKPRVANSDTFSAQVRSGEWVKKARHDTKGHGGDYGKLEHMPPHLSRAVSQLWILATREEWPSVIIAFSVSEAGRNEDVLVKYSDFLNTRVGWSLQASSLEPLLWILGNY